MEKHSLTFDNHIDITSGDFTLINNQSCDVINTTITKDIRFFSHTVDIVDLFVVSIGDTQLVIV